MRLEIITSVIYLKYLSFAYSGSNKLSLITLLEVGMSEKHPALRGSCR